MEIVYGKQLNSEQMIMVNQIAFACGISFDTARLLFYRNVDTVEKAKRFLSPSKENFHSASLLKNIDQAVQRINIAKINNENILVFGDYDADGVCASTVLYKSLRDYGITNLNVYVPEREEGYGLNIQTIENLLQEFSIDLIITVDCGISDFDKIETLKQMGIDVVVTDHHEPPEQLPDCICINPKLAGQDYPFNGLCGAGVAYKLCTMLIGDRADKYLDYVALATVADSMDLIDENRDIVDAGLKIFNNQNKLRLAFKYLLGENSKKITAQTLAYQVAPRVNAGGRMGDAGCVLNLFITENPNTIFDLAVKLNEYNLQRQVECDNIYQQARRKILKHSLHKKNIILVKNKNWQVGFIGIVASKLVEEFSRPVIVFAGQEDYLKGSARSVDGINIYDAIMGAKEHLLGFGGHSQAAGVSVTEENFLVFEKAVSNIIKEQTETMQIVPRINIEWEIEGELNKNFVRELELLEPYGVGNKKPLFSKSAYQIQPTLLKAGSQHYSFKCDDIEMLNFNGEADVFNLRLPIKKHIVFEFNASVFKGKEYFKGFVKCVSPDYSDLSCLSLYAINEQLSMLENEQGEFEYIDKNAVKQTSGIGTLYVVNDVENLKEYQNLKNKGKSFGYPQSKNCSDELVVALNKEVVGYDKIIYLDKPLQPIKSKVKTFVVQDFCGYKFVEKLSTDRNDFAQIYSHFMGLKNKPVVDLVSFVEQNCAYFEKEQLLFGLKVFIELNIFAVVNGKFVHNEKVKNTLTNSSIYSKIVLLKG